MSDKKSECKFCGAEVAWGRNLPNNRPADPSAGKEHVCDPERKKAHQANKAAEELARQKASEMGGNGNSTNNNSQNILGIEVYLKGQLEELRRAVDHLGKIAMFVESLDFRVKKIEGSLINTTPPSRPVLSSSPSSSSDDNDGEIIGGIQEQ